MSSTMNMLLVLVTLTLTLTHVVVAAGAKQSKELNNYPIIGVFTQPSSSHQGDCGGNCLYLAASYVKYLEGSGARVVPINYYSSNEVLDELFDSLNGFFFPGGGAVYPASAQYIFDKTVAANKNGDFMPLWGTCMGFQWLLIGAANNVNVLDPSDGTQLDSYNLSIPLDFTKKALTSKIFNRASKKVMTILATENVTMNNHHYGIYPEHFDSVPELYDFYDVLSTNKDRSGIEFLSTIESKDYPIFGTQWHPEKNNYEWAMEADGTPLEGINHSPEAVEVSQYTSNFFVSMVRNNDHSFKSTEALDAALIWNYKATKTTGDFVQTYFFKNNF